VSLVSTTAVAGRSRGGVSVDITGEQPLVPKKNWPTMNTAEDLYASCAPQGVKDRRDWWARRWWSACAMTSARDAAIGPMVIILAAELCRDQTPKKRYDCGVLLRCRATDTCREFHALPMKASTHGRHSSHRPRLCASGRRSARRRCTGGPGYHIEAEFTATTHEKACSRWRGRADPIERPRAMPRSDAANSARQPVFCLPGIKKPQANATAAYTASAKS